MDPARRLALACRRLEADEGLDRAPQDETRCRNSCWLSRRSQQDLPRGVSALPVHVLPQLEGIATEPAAGGITGTHECASVMLSPPSGAEESPPLPCIQGLRSQQACLPVGPFLFHSSISSVNPATGTVPDCTGSGGPPPRESLAVSGESENEIVRRLPHFGNGNTRAG